MNQNIGPKILSELQNFGARCFSGMPPSKSVLSTHDVVLLTKWTPQDLLQLARRYSAQVAVYSEKALEPALMPLVDWVLSSEEDVILLQQKCEKNYDATLNIPLLEKKKSALFLDRDGVVNVDYNYVCDPAKVVLIPYVSLLISSAKSKNQDVIIVTNQSGIGRGYYSVEDFNRVMTRISELLHQDQASLDWIEFSPFHSENTQEEFKLGRQFRKPRPGMIHRAAEKRGIVLKSSTMIGDRSTDLKAAILAGVGRIYLYHPSPNPHELLECRSWIETLRKDYALDVLKDGIQLSSINSLAEAELE